MHELTGQFKSSAQPVTTQSAAPGFPMSADSNASDRPTRIGSYEVHPLANCFPLMRGDQFEDFLESIRVHGQQNPVVLLEGKILEGRNRALAVHQLGKELKTVQFEDLKIAKSPLEYVIFSNLHRRHLTDSERVQIAKDLKKLLDEEKANKSGTQVPLYKNQNETRRGNKGTTAIAAAQVGVSKQAVNRALAQEKAIVEYREKIVNILGKSLGEIFFQKLDQGYPSY